jgi:hypothetical protein
MKSHRIFFIASVLFLLCLILSGANAQEGKNKSSTYSRESVSAEDEPETESFYMGVEMGVAKNYRNFIQMGGWLQTDRDYYRLRIAGAIDEPFRLTYSDNKEITTNYPKGKAVYDFGFIYGRYILLSKNHHLRFGSGISIIQKVDPDEVYNSLKPPEEPYRILVRYGVGLPLEIRYGYSFFQGFEIVSSVNGNINRLKSYTGISIGIVSKFL